MALTNDDKLELINAMKAESQKVDELGRAPSLDDVDCLMALKGDELVLTPVSLLGEPVEEAASAALEAAGRADMAAKECATKKTSAFAGIVKTADYTLATAISYDGIYYIESERRFFAIHGNVYYANWPTCSEYNSSVASDSTPHADKIYICDGVVYMWNGQKLVSDFSCLRLDMSLDVTVGSGRSAIVAYSVKNGESFAPGQLRLLCNGMELLNGSTAIEGCITRNIENNIDTYVFEAFKGVWQGLKGERHSVFVGLSPVAELDGMIDSAYDCKLHYVSPGGRIKGTLAAPADDAYLFVLAPKMIVLSTCVGNKPVLLDKRLELKGRVELDDGIYYIYKQTEYPYVIHDGQIDYDIEYYIINE